MSGNGYNDTKMRRNHVMNDEFFFDVYARYRNKLKDLRWDVKLMPYDWLQIPSSVSIEWFPFVEMAREHTKEIANDGNLLAISKDRLFVWSKVLNEFPNDQDKLEITVEFVTPVAHLAIDLPYAIRSRFILSVSHLSHQANRKKVANWKDDLKPDRNIDYKVMKKVALHWNTFEQFNKKLALINNDAFKAKLLEARDKFHHRFPPSFVVGITQPIVRITEKSGKIAYGLEGFDPLSTEEVCAALEDQYQAVFECFSAYQALVREQVLFIFGSDGV